MNLYIKLLLFLTASITVFMVLLVTAVFLSRQGPRTSVPKIATEPETLGSGKSLVFVVLGDSTSAGQGGDYSTGIARSSALYLAKNNKVIFYNFSVSGARVKDVLGKQLPKTKGLEPDVILLSVGANDATRLTSLKNISGDFNKLLRTAISQNCKAKIIPTGSPDMGAIPRIVQPLRWLAGMQSKRINNTIDSVSHKYDIARAPIHEETGPLFRADRSLFAIDRYHPNDRGYQTWVPVLTDSIASALKNQPSHCS